MVTRPVKGGARAWRQMLGPDFLTRVPVCAEVGGVGRDAHGPAVDPLLASPPFYSHHANSCLGNLHLMRIGGWHRAWQNRKMESASPEGCHWALYQRPSLNTGLSCDTVPFGLSQFQSGFLFCVVTGKLRPSIHRLHVPLARVL